MVQFYSHLIEIEHLHRALHDVRIEAHERKELIMTAESGIHHVVIDTVLTELSEKERKQFLKHLAEDDHEKIWAHLKTHTVDIEHKIAHAAHAFLKILHADLEKMK